MLMNRIKVLIIGTENIGEVSFKKIVDRYFQTDYKQIVGVNVLSKSISVPINEENIDVAVSLWDISSKKRFEEIRTLFYSGGAGAFFVFDLNKPPSWYQIIEFYKEVEIMVDKIPFTVVGYLETKQKTKIDFEEINTWAINHGGTFVKLNPNDFNLLESTFLNLIKKIMS
jgi:GTPase SAR1 family protein